MLSLHTKIIKIACTLFLILFLKSVAVFAHVVMFSCIHIF